MYRRKDAEMQNFRALASKARADGKALLARADSDAALFSEEVSLHPVCILELISACFQNTGCC